MRNIPNSQPKRFGALILIDLRRSIAHHSLSKTKMIVGERVLRSFPDHFGVKTNRLRVVFDTQGVVRADVADLLLSSARKCVAPNPRVEQRDSAGN